MIDIKTILSSPLKKGPVSAQFIDTIKPEITKAVFKEHPKNPASSKILPQNIVTNYHYITLLGREISDNLVIFSEKGLIPSWNIRHIDRGMSEDMDATWKIAEESGNTKEYTEDFTLLTEFFLQLAGRYLSKHQQDNSEYLKEVLKTILIIDYSLFTAEFITAANNQKTNPKTMRILTRKKNELLKYFESEFTKYSNLKFDFKSFKELWGNLNQMDYKASQKFLHDRVK